MNADVPCAIWLAAAGWPTLDSPILHAVAEWAWRASWQATLLAGLVLAVRAALGKRLSGRARAALWWVVLARLLLPPIPLHRPTLWHPASPPAAWGPTAMSPTLAIPTATDPNFGKSLPTYPAGSDRNALTSPLAGGRESRSLPPEYRRRGITLPRESGTVPAQREPIHELSRVPINSSVGRLIPRLSDALPWLAVVWATGAMLLLARLAGGAITIVARLRRMQPLHDPTLDIALKSYAPLIGLPRSPRVLAAPGFGGPAVAGVIRPALLVPPELPARLTADELRMVLLHELAHIKRRDLPLSWLLGVLAALHWFNPLLGWAIRRVRADRELACDEAAIRAAGPEPDPCRGRAYGAALLRLAELLSNRFRPDDDSCNVTIPAAIPAAPGVLPAFRTARELDRRIAMAVRFFPTRPLWPSLLCGALLVAAGVLLVDAAEPAARSAPATTPALRTGIAVNRPASGQLRSVPILGEIPILGRLFQTAAPAERPSAQTESAPDTGGARPAPPTGIVAPAPAPAPAAVPAPASDVAPPPVPGPGQATPPNGRLEVIRAKLDAKHAELAAATEALAAAEHAADSKAISKVDLLQARASVAKLQAELVELEWDLKSASAAAAPVQPPSSPPPAYGMVGGRPGQPGGFPGGPVPQQQVQQPQGNGGTLAGAPRIETDAERAADSQTEAKLEKVLPEVKFEGVGLSDVVAFMKDSTGVGFFVDWGAVRQAGIDLNTPVSVEARQIPAAVALDRILRSASGDVRLGYVVDHGQVFISTADRLNQMLVTRTYDVSSLPPDKDLPQLIGKFVAPDSWVDNGGSVGRIERFGDRLIVTQSKLNFPQLDRFMALLREDHARTSTTSETPPAPPANAPASGAPAVR